MSRRERNKAEKLVRIREASWALFRELGFEATTTKAIAEQAGIGTGTLFLYARTKSELLVLLFRDEIQAILAERITTMAEGLDPAERFVHVARGFYERYARDPELAQRFVKLVLTLEGPSREAMRALDSDVVARLAHELESERVRGYLRADVDPARLALNFAAIYGVHVLEYLMGGCVDPERSLALLDGSLHMLLDGTRT